jgi:hypothetical protein
MSKLTTEQKATLLVALKESLAKSSAGMQALSNIEVGDEISIVDFKTESTNPRANVSPENPSYIFEAKNRRKFAVSGQGIPTMRVLSEGKDASVLGAELTLAANRNNPDMEFFKQALESLDEGKAIDITAVTFKCVAKLAQSDMTDAAKPAMLPSCYKKYDDYLAETRATDVDWNEARTRLHTSGLKPEFVNKSWAVEADRKYYSTTPVFSVNWGQ